MDILVNSRSPTVVAATIVVATPVAISSHCLDGAFSMPFRTCPSGGLPRYNAVMLESIVPIVVDGVQALKTGPNRPRTSHKEITATPELVVRSDAVE